MTKQIVVTVEASGEVKIEAVGFKGNSCQRATEALERALGVTGKRTPKPEFYQQTAQGAKVQQ